MSSVVSDSQISSDIVSETHLIAAIQLAVSCSSYTLLAVVP